MFNTWITDGTGNPFYVRKKINIEKKIVVAEAKVCGLGQFEFHINGRKVSDHELDPAWTDYHKWIMYVTFDVTDYLQTGTNVIGAEVGNGWYRKMDQHYTFTFPSFMPENPNPYRPFGNVLVFSMELTVQYEDGTKAVFTSDDSFKTKEHPVVMTNVYGSETIDGRKEQHGWDMVCYEDETWQKAKYVEPKEIPRGELKNQYQPPVKVIKSYESKYLWTVNDREIYDFGQNMSGILTFKVRGKSGDTVKLYPAEKLGGDNDVDQVAKDWVTVDSCITYIIGEDDIWETCRMRFTYFAGRYVAVEKGGNVEFFKFRADAISSAYKTDGRFSCDDKRYEQIYHMIEKTVEANLLGVHTDCPTIERFAWQEPNHLMASSIFYMKDGSLLWKKFLQDMRYAQHTKDDYFYDMEGKKYYPGEGLMPSQCPCYIPNVLPVPGLGDFYDIIPWGSTCILGTHWHYLFYGDKSIIEENYDAGMEYLNYLKRKVNKDGFINHGLGDWGNPKKEYARENIETAFLFADAKVLSEFADILGKQEDGKKLREYAQEIKDNYNRKLLKKFEKEGFYCYVCGNHPDEIFMTQAAQALPLFWGMVPDDKQEDVRKALRCTLEREGALICGEVGLPYVIQAACQGGMNDILCKYILQKEHPSYYAFILDGETTLGEYWEKNPRSHCHDMMGHIIEWYYNGIAGIIPDRPGFKEVTIRPYLPESIHSFSCSYHSVLGEIVVEVEETVEVEKNSIVLRVKIPDGVKANLDMVYLRERGNVDERIQKY